MYDTMPPRPNAMQERENWGAFGPDGAPWIHNYLRDQAPGAWSSTCPARATGFTLRPYASHGVCLECLFSRSPGQAPYGAKPAVTVCEYRLGAPRLKLRLHTTLTHQVACSCRCLWMFWLCPVVCVCLCVWMSVFVECVLACCNSAQKQ